MCEFCQLRFCYKKETRQYSSVKVLLLAARPTICIPQVGLRSSAAGHPRPRRSSQPVLPSLLRRVLPGPPHAALAPARAVLEGPPGHPDPHPHRRGLDGGQPGPLGRGSGVVLAGRLPRLHAGRPLPAATGGAGRHPVHPKLLPAGAAGGRVRRPAGPAGGPALRGHAHFFQVGVVSFTTSRILPYTNRTFFPAHFRTPSVANSFTNRPPSVVGSDTGYRNGHQPRFSSTPSGTPHNVTHPRSGGVGGGVGGRGGGGSVSGRERQPFHVVPNRPGSVTGSIEGRLAAGRMMGGGVGGAARLQQLRGGGGQRNTSNSALVGTKKNCIWYCVPVHTLYHLPLVGRDIIQ